MENEGIEPIEVTVRFDREGGIHPIKFAWHGSQTPVASTGRCWKDDIGQHILVMDHLATVYELVFSPVEGRWFLRKTRQSRKNILPT